VEVLSDGEFPLALIKEVPCRLKGGVEVPGLAV